MSQIEKLTPHQEAQLSVYAEKWLKIGLSTEPCNFEEAKKYAKMAYEAAGLTPPEEFLLEDSPISCINMLRKRGIVADMFQICYGCHDAGWLSFYDFFDKECGLNLRLLDGLLGIAQHCGWWMPFDTFCVFQHRPCEIHMNDRGLLHNEQGPSILFRDGFSVWSIDGVRVNEQIVKRPETLTIEQISGETNAEVKRIMIERFGTGRYLSEIKAELVDADVEGATQGAAPRCLVKGSDGTKWLYGTDGSTKRGYYIPVQEDAETCKKAHSDIAGFDEGRIIAKS